MSTPAAAPARRRRNPLRLIVSPLLLILIVGGGLYWLNTAAQAATNAVATLTVFQAGVSVSHDGGTTYAPAGTGTLIQPGDSVKTDATGRASVQLPDGTLTRLATKTEITFTSAHFSKSGSVHDVTVTEVLGRTLSNVQHLAAGASFKVAAHSASASVRGTQFEVVEAGDFSLVIKLFDGELDVDGKRRVHLTAGQQVTVDPLGNVSDAGPIQPDPTDPFISEMAALQKTSDGTTPGTEQDYIGPPLHDGENQLYTYSFAGGGLIKAALGYRGSLMALKIQGPDGKTYSGSGAPPVVIIVPNALAGIYQLQVSGVSGLGPGEEPFLSVAALEPCTSANLDQNGAVRRGYTAVDLANAIHVAGLTNLKLAVVGSSTAGAIITGTATFNGVGITGTMVVFMHEGMIEVIAVSATVFGVSIPSQQAVQQIGAAIGQDPSHINPGFIVDRMFTCSGVVMIDGRVFH